MEQSNTLQQSAEQSQFFIQTLTNGVQVVAQRIAGVQSVAVGFFIGTGARDESPAQAGISHLTETMMFRGTEHLSSRELIERLDSLGVTRQSSAGLEMTLFSGVMLGDQLEATLDLFADVLRYPAFPADDLEAVRALQLQEIAQREEQPAQLLMDRLRHVYFAGSPFSHDTLGTPETVRSLVREQLFEYWRARYTANNIVIALAGNFDWERVIDQLERLTSTWPEGSGRMLVHEPPINPTTMIEERQIAQENIGFAFPGVAQGDPHYYEAALLSVALGGGMHSRLFTEVREKRGLAYAVSSRFDGMEKTGIVRIYAGTQPERAHETVDVILNQLVLLEEKGITDEELELAKTRLKSQLVMNSENTAARMTTIGRDWWYQGRLRSLQQVREEIDRVTVTSIHAYLQSINLTKNLAFVALGPLDSSKLQVRVASLK
jgi:predicted Zn-dependent peptidase